MLGLVLGLPLLGFLINGLIGHRFSAKVSGVIASSTVLGSFLGSASLFFQLHNLSESQRVIEQILFNWINISDLSLPFILRFDPLTAVMCFVVTGVGFLIHVYSIGYMGHDQTPGKFFAFLNLFTFAMLALVLGGNLPLLFLGWEGVGLCSYLLIGYWYDDQAKASAGKKAFIVNRIGDLGFLIGIFTLYSMFGTLDILDLKHATVNAGSQINVSLLTFATTCLFIGAIGKSAQIPLYVWLPDAMAGPTPVSALIHAATMVTAGVYMVARLNFLYVLTPTTLMLVSGVGALTALFSATIALTQRDIKKVLAYSTVSQLGFMFVAVGVGAFVAGIFHLVTHAFFKALLFLGSGSVIHGMHKEQDIMKMGGLKKHMPKTYATFLIGSLAIAGFPLLSGFFSKDEILLNSFSSQLGFAGPFLWMCCSFTAFLTAFYMTRLTCLTFLGEARFKEEHVHVHESPAVMVVPLLILAGLSIIGGFIGLPGYSWIGQWLAPVVGESHGEHGATAVVVMIVSILIAFAGMGTGYYFYVLKPELPKKWQQNFTVLYQLLLNKYYVDELYDMIVVNPVKKCAYICWKVFDVFIVDGSVLAFARMTQFAGEVSRLAHTGALQVYAAAILIGLIATIGTLIYGLH